MIAEKVIASILLKLFFLNAALSVSEIVHPYNCASFVNKEHSSSLFLASIINAR